MKRVYSLIGCVPLLLMMAGCSEGTKPVASEPKEPEPPPEAVTAQQAFHQMYIIARSWAPDAKPLRMASLDLQEIKSEGGKAGAWECTFVSEQRRRARRYTYSVVETTSPILAKGVSAGSEDSWAGGGQAKPFLVQAFKTDSVAAYEVAMKRGADYAKKNPNLPIKFLLEQTSRFPNPAWRVFWGESVSTSGYSIFVDASDGSYLATSR
ncbi:MAG TPA: hypothetical protein PLA43_03300 [Bryobacteraceae bacterium]|nr:hypothetical protein [Bryobacteraceae bacterium]HOQ45834.1 hypothetical protein [Bryobacteraceae bacterium]HPQ14114.1 hypothetical protein [Bryobacteraceae bacterium]HPU70957.1 hypothetical protein [Bryobacteraceae bacterium]